jgi:hypothetical protein
MTPIRLDTEIEIRTAVWFAINDTIHLSGAREEKFWNESDPRDQELMQVLDLKTVELTKRIMEIITKPSNADRVS